MPSVQRTAEVVWSGSIARGTGMASGGSGALRNVPMTLASRMGEPQGKTSPEELIAAAHAGCFAMSLGSILAGRGTPPERLDVSATVTLEMSGTPRIASSELVVHGAVPGSDQGRFAASADEAERACLVSRALRGHVEIRVHAILDEQPASSVA
jgi:lipoyl-dependent peroxiredoxin